MSGRISFFDEIIVDNFAGGGGTSTGIELATGRVVDVAINHDPAAIRMHRTNHPYTRHYQESVWDIDPRKVCEGHPVGLAWFSPDCKHFSKAKGGKPVEKKIRGLAWVVMRWAGLVRPRVIILENVEEFQTWGPVRRGKPVKSRKGETFRKFVFQLQNLGYAVEWRELVAADYGAPTTRKRFFLIARCDGKPIVWPRPTHAPRDSAAVRSGELQPWRSAAEIIDWTLPCPSIFDSREEIRERYGLTAQRPLRPNTLRRAIRCVEKFVIQSDEPFLTSATIPNTGSSVGSPTTEPVHTITTAGNQMLVTASLIQYHSEQGGGVRGQEISRPLLTIDAAPRYGLVAATLMKYYGGDHHGQQIREPLHTITTKDRAGLLEASLQKVGQGEVQSAHLMELYGTSTGREIQSPLSTVTASGAHHAVIVTTLQQVDAAGRLGHWPELRELLHRHCGYTIEADEILPITVAGEWYFISDIGLRMLTPRELYSANGLHHRPGLPGKPVCKIGSGCPLWECGTAAFCSGAGPGELPGVVQSAGPADHAAGTERSSVLDLNGREKVK